MSQPAKKSDLKPAPKAPPPPSTTGKRAVVFGIPVLIAIWLHIAIGSVLQNGLSGHWWLVALGVIAFAALLATVGLAAAVSTGSMALLVVPAGVALSSILTGFAWQTAAGAAIEIVALLMLMMNVRHEVAGRVRFSVIKILTYGMTFTIGLMLLAIAMFSYASLVQNSSTGRLQNSIIEGTVKGLNASLPLVIKGYSPDMTVDELIRRELPDTETLTSTLRTSTYSQAEREAFEKKLLDAGIDPDGVNLDQLFAARPNERVALLNEIDGKIAEATSAAIDVTRDRIGESFGVVLDGNERVEVALQDILRERVNRLTQPNEHLVPPIVALSIFLTLELFTGAYLWLTWFLGSLLFSVYRSTALVTKIEETVEATRYEIA